MSHHQLLAAPAQHLQAADFVLRGMRGVFALIYGLLVASLCAFLAKRKGYSVVLFGILGFFFSLITLIVLLFIPRKK